MKKPYKIVILFLVVSLGLFCIGKKQVNASEPKICTVSEPRLIGPDSHSVLYTSFPTFEWTPVEGAKSYTFQMAYAGDFPKILYSATVPKNIFQIKKRVSKGPMWYWRVRANLENCSTDWAIKLKFHIFNPPNPPVLVTPKNGVTVKPANITFAWRKSAKISPPYAYYHIQIADNYRFESPLVDMSTIDYTQTKYVLTTTSLSAGKKYYWRVRAGNAYSFDPDWSKWSTVQYFKVSGPIVVE